MSVDASPSCQGEKIILLQKPPAARWWVIVMGILAYGHFFMTMQLISSMTTTVMEDLDITVTECTWLLTATKIGFAVFTLFGGPLGTKLGSRKTITLGLILNSVFNLLFPWGAAAYEGAFILCLLQGFGGGLISGSAISATCRWFPARSRGLATGIFTGMVGSMFTIASVCCPILVSIGLSWQQTVAVMGGIPAAVLAVVYFATVKDFGETYPGYASVDDILPESVSMPEKTAAHKRIKIREGRKPDSMGEFFRSARVWMAGMLIFITGWMQLGLGSLFPQLLLFDYALPDDQVASITGLAFLGMMVGCPLGGIISDRVFDGVRYPMLIIGAIFTGAMFLLIPHTPVSLMALVLFLTYGGNASICGPFWSVPSELVTGKMAVMASAFCSTMRTIGRLAASLFMPITAAAVGTYLVPVYICAALAFAGVIPALVIRR